MALSIDWLYRDIFQILDSSQVEEFFASQQRMEAQSATESTLIGPDILQRPDAQAEPASEQIFLALSQKIEAHGKPEVGPPPSTDLSIDLSTPIKAEPIKPETLPGVQPETNVVATEGTAAIESAVSEAIRSVDSALDPAASAEAKDTLIQVAEVIRETAANADDPNTSSVPAETAETVMKLLTLSQLAMPELKRVYEAFISSSFPENVAREMIDVLRNPYFQIFSYRFGYADSFDESRFNSQLAAVSGRDAQAASERGLEDQISLQQKDNEARRRQILRDRTSDDRRAELTVDREPTSEKDRIRQLDLRNLTQSRRRV